MKRATIQTANMTRGVLLLATLRFGLLGLTCLLTMLVSLPTWAPEDPWRLVAEVPGTPTPKTIAAGLLDRFLDDHGVRISSSLRDAISHAIAEHGLRHGLEPRLLFSMILSESSFRTDVVSNKGAVGLMQLLPSTAAAIAPELDLELRSASRLRDPQVNIALGAHYLDQMLDVFEGDLNLALTAYNMGPTALRDLLERRRVRTASAPFTSSYSRGVVARLARAETTTAQAL
jgi:soluble lytic murein transglycosylase-like protein